MLRYAKVCTVRLTVNFRFVIDFFFYVKPKQISPHFFSGRILQSKLLILLGNGCESVLCVLQIR